MGNSEVFPQIIGDMECWKMLILSGIQDLYDLKKWKFAIDLGKTRTYRE